MTDAEQDQRAAKRRCEGSSIGTPSRPRTLLACLPCRRRKVKCNGARPNCGNCLRFNDECKWPQVGSNESSVMPLIPNQHTIDEALTNEQKQILVELLFNTPHLAFIRQGFHRPSIEADSAGLQLFTRAAVCSLSALYLSESDISQYFNGEQPLIISARFADIAQRLSMESSFQPTIESIQANLCMGLRELLADVGNSTWMYTGLAIRMAQALGLGTEYHQRHPFQQREIRRRTMWTCFIMDRLVSYVISRPQCMRSSKINIQLPCPESSFIFGEEYDGPTLHKFEAVCPPDSNILSFLIKAVELWSLAADQFASWALNHADGAAIYEANLQTAAAEVQHWRNNLPQRVRWSQTNYRSHKLLGQGGTFVSLHMLLLHARCISQQGYLPFEGHFGSWSNRANEAATACQQLAGEIFQIATSLNAGDDIDKANLFSPFSGLAITCAASIYVWDLYAHSTTASWEEADVRPPVNYISEICLGRLKDILRHWASTWRLARSWLETLALLSKLYSVAFGKELLLADQGEGERPVISNAENEVAVGSGFPEPGVMQREFGRLHLFMSAISESSALRREQAKLHIQDLLKQMWLGSYLDAPDILDVSGETGTSFDSESV